MSNTDPLAARRARSVPVLWPSVSSPPHFTRREVGFSHVRIDLDAVARLVLDDEISLFPERAFFDDQVRPPTHIVRQLVDTEVAHRCRGVHGRDGADGARRGGGGAGGGGVGRGGRAGSAPPPKSSGWGGKKGRWVSLPASRPASG